jgi:hypothetical protein
METQVMRNLESRRPRMQRPAVCEHSSTEHLGVNRNVTFLRCRRCAHVLVLQGSRCWDIPPADLHADG